MNNPILLIAQPDGLPWLIGHAAGDVSAHRNRERAFAITPLPSGGAPEATALALRQALNQLGYRGQGLILGLPAAWCLSASADAEKLPRRGRELALMYRLEEQIPIAAELLAADFVLSRAEPRVTDGIEPSAGTLRAPGTRRALGIAASAARLTPWIEALEKQGIHIDRICPTALLVAQAVADDQNTALLIGESNGLSLIRVRRQVPYAWTSLPVDIDRLGVEFARQPTASLFAVDVPTCVFDAIQHLAGVSELQRSTEPAGVIAARLSHAILNSNLRPWVDLRRGPLANPDLLRSVRSPLRWAVGAFVLLSVTLAVGLLVRAHRYRLAADFYAAQETQALHQAIPNATLAIGPLRHLQSELRRLRGTADAPTAGPPRESTLTMLAGVLNALPRDLRYRVLEIRLGDGLLYLEGQVRSHGDAELIAGNLRRSAGLEVDAPNTQQQDGAAIAFTLTGGKPNSGGTRASQANQDNAP